jgi:hypothetical protein
MTKLLLHTNQSNQLLIVQQQYLPMLHLAPP